MKNTNIPPKKDEVATECSIEVVNYATLESEMDFLECPDPRIMGILTNADIESEDDLMDLLFDYLDK